MNHSREREHTVLIDWLLDQVDAQSVDAVLIAGDIFDTGTPPSYARALYYRLIAQLHQRKVALLISSVVTATREQTLGISQVNDALNDLDAVTQDNARLAEESAHCAQDMNTNAGILRRTLDVFRM